MMRDTTVLACVGIGALTVLECVAIVTGADGQYLPAVIAGIGALAGGAGFVAVGGERNRNATEATRERP